MTNSGKFRTREAEKANSAATSDFSEEVSLASARSRKTGPQLYDESTGSYYDIPLNRGFRIGRHPDLNDLAISSPYVSGTHCTIEHGCYLHDGNGEGKSTNGIFVNGKKVSGLRKILRDGDKISLGRPGSEGSYSFIFYKGGKE
jgi:hypothetical protein